MLDTIPNIYHFVFLGFTPFMYTHYLSILTCLIVQNPDILYIYTHHPPTGKWWDSLVQNKLYTKIVQEKVDLPTQIFGNPIEKYQHMADVIRLEKLIERGGVYLDLDVISIRSLKPVLTHRENIKKGCVMGIQCPNTKFMGLCNAVIIARSQSLFLQKWYSEYKTFRKTRWDYHSVKLPYVLSQLVPEHIRSLPSWAFFPITWEEPQFIEDRSLDDRLSKSFLVHIWHSEWSKNILRGEGPWLLQKKSTFAKIVSSILINYNRTAQLHNNSNQSKICKTNKNNKNNDTSKPEKYEKQVSRVDSKPQNSGKPEQPEQPSPPNRQISPTLPSNQNKLLDISLCSKDSLFQEKLTQINLYYDQLPLIFKDHSQETISVKKIKAQCNLHHIIKTKQHDLKSILRPQIFPIHTYDIDDHLRFFPHSIYPINSLRAIQPEFNKYHECFLCDITNKQIITITLQQCIRNIVKHYMKDEKYNQEINKAIPYCNSIHRVGSHQDAFYLFTSLFPNTRFFLVSYHSNIFKIGYMYQTDMLHEMTAIEHLALPSTIYLFKLVDHPTIISSYSILKNYSCCGCIAKNMIEPLKKTGDLVLPRYPILVKDMFNHFKKNKT